MVYGTWYLVLGTWYLVQRLRTQYSPPFNDRQPMHQRPHFLPHGLTLAAVLLVAPAHAAGPFHQKHDLFVAGYGGYKLYHIPGLLVTAKGTVLAWCEARKKGSDWDDIHILLRRSTDDGQTWS